jgi:hypothetical protein
MLSSSPLLLSLGLNSGCYLVSLSTSLKHSGIILLHLHLMINLYFSSSGDGYYGKSAIDLIDSKFSGSLYIDFIPNISMRSCAATFC